MTVYMLTTCHRLKTETKMCLTPCSVWLQYNYFQVSLFVTYTMSKQTVHFLVRIHTHETIKITITCQVTCKINY